MERRGARTNALSAVERRVLPSTTLTAGSASLSSCRSVLGGSAYHAQKWTGTTHFQETECGRNTREQIAVWVPGFPGRWHYSGIFIHGRRWFQSAFILASMPRCSTTRPTRSRIAEQRLFHSVPAKTPGERPNAWHVKRCIGPINQVTFPFLSFSFGAWLPRA